ncbi:MAG: preprotein translocase subunit SecE [Planctomyces sp.]|nr:preprotein translocase subunit SecE [Planctomyces sp.]
MPLGMHKPGQGYWVRVMTATLIGLFTLGAAYWGWTQSELVAVRLPSSTWSFTGALDSALSSGDGSKLPTLGTKLTLQGPASEGGERPTIATGTIARRLATSDREFLVTGVEFAQGNASLERVASAALPDGSALITNIARASRQPLIQPALIQGGFAGLFMLLGSVAAYWFCASNPRSADFLINTDFEMRKVNWSTPTQIRGYTWVVIFSALFVSAVLLVFDTAFALFFGAVGIIPS